MAGKALGALARANSSPRPLLERYSPSFERKAEKDGLHTQEI
jgi:hypothetical protein